MNLEGTKMDESKPLPVMFNYRLSTLASLVSSEQLAEFESTLRASLGDKMDKEYGYVGGTISYTDLDGDGFVTIGSDEATDSDYIGPW
jgi:hypothetical protein